MPLIIATVGEPPVGQNIFPAEVKVNEPRPSNVIFCPLVKVPIEEIIVRQKKEFRRADGTRIKFEDNAAVVLKDEKGNPKGTIFKGPIAKEVTERWPAVAKVASIVV